MNRATKNNDPDSICIRCERPSGECECDSRERIRVLGEMAEDVGEQKSILEASIATERRLKAELLRLLVDAVRPALKALASPVGSNMRGLLVGKSKGFLGRKAKGGHLYLCEDGQFWVEGTAHHLGPEEVVAARWDVGQVFEACGSALASQLDGNAGMRVEQIRARAERLHAVSVLLKEAAT